MVLFDRFVKGIYDGNFLSDVEFKLFERRNGEIVTAKYRVGYVVLLSTMDICVGLLLFLLSK